MVYKSYAEVTQAQKTSTGCSLPHEYLSYKAFPLCRICVPEKCHCENTLRYSREIIDNMKIEKWNLYDRKI